MVIILTFFSLLSVQSVAATDWYVRPANGNYGLENGTNYDNAWDGLLKVVWGDEGVRAGDTLWVCGLHLYDVIDKYSHSQKNINLISGQSDTQRITIRGDYPSDNGIIWGAGRIAYADADWQNEGNGVWSIPLIGGIWAGDWIFQDIGVPEKHSHIILDKVLTLDELRAKPGSHYSKNYLAGSKLYIHPTDKKKPTGRISSNWWGYNFNYAELKYVTFKNLTFYNPSRIDPNARLSHVRWEGCRLSYGMHSLLAFNGANDFIEIINCELSWAGNGIYNIQQNWQGGDEEINKTTTNYVYKNNHIHHIGSREVNYNSDAHAIGIQGGYNGVIEGNIIEECGSGIALYAFTNQELKNTIVRNNFVKDIHQLGGATGWGIFTSCNSDSLSDKNGNRFYNNIVSNSPICFRFQFEDEQLVYNNIANNCNIGLESSRNYNNIGAHIKAYNNIFLNSKEFHINWYSGSTEFNMHFDNNLYYPVSEQLFFLRNQSVNFQQWKQLSGFHGKFDQNSLANNPLFTNHSGLLNESPDFSLQPESPVIDKGKVVSRTHDFVGNEIKRLPDIGAYEYQGTIKHYPLYIKEIRTLSTFE